MKPKYSNTLYIIMMKNGIRYLVRVVIVISHDFPIVFVRNVLDFVRQHVSRFPMTYSDPVDARLMFTEIPNAFANSLERVKSHVFLIAKKAWNISDPERD